MGLMLQWTVVGACLVWAAKMQAVINGNTTIVSPSDWGGGWSWGERERETAKDERWRVEDGRLAMEGLGYGRVKRDVNDVPPGCKTPLSVNHISQEWQRSEGCIIGICDAGYESPFGGREMMIMCVDGEWEQLPWPDPSNPSCVPLCSPACRAGRCVAPNSCECPYGLQGNLCEVATGCSEPPLIPHHALFFMGQPGSGKLTCEEGYGFPNNKTEIYLVCIDGQWFAPWVEEEENAVVTWGRVKGDGIMCRRKLHLEGLQRNYRDTKRNGPTFPHVPHAMVILVDDESSFTWTFEVSCFPGYYIRNTNLTKIKIQLDGGVWKTSRDLVVDFKDVSCVLPCADAEKGMNDCQNGGSCVEGVCVCPTKYMGQFCEIPRCSHANLPTLHHAYYFYGDEVTPDGNPLLNVQCQKGFFFPDNSTVALVKCSKGLWDFGPGQVYQRCRPRCSVVCMSPMVCVGENECGCEQKDMDRVICKALAQGDRLPLIYDGQVVQKQDGSYSAKCKKGYQINNQQQLDMAFYNDTWLLVGVFPGYAYRCKPQCSPPCNNRQECFKPNQCRCLPYFEGKNCENLKPTVYPCPSFFPYIPYSKVSKDGELVCMGGYKLSDNLNSTKLTCVNGQYQVEEGDGKCHPVCNPGCYNGGTCVAPGLCVCKKGFSGRRCQLTECPISMPELLFTVILQCTFERPYLISKVGYKFPTGEDRIPIDCVNGEWRSVYNITLVPSEPKCDPACVNGGVCIAPQKCSCPAGFGGDQCQLPKKCSSSLPTGLVNAKFWDKGETGVAFCTDGYTFNSRSGAETNITCVKGNWDITINGERRNELVKIRPQHIGEMVLFQLGCLPLCNPPCLNGGTCVSHNLCICPDNEHGGTCHLHTCLCPLPHIRNANYLYGDTMAIVKCKPGFRFSYGGEVITLTCQDTEWIVHRLSSFVPPSCLPICEQECLNGGVCQEDGTCGCPPGYIGLSCEIRQDEQCFDAPPAIDNTMLTITNHTGMYTCLPGFRLANGSEVTVQLECHGSQWVFPDYNDTTPQCEFWCQPGDCGLEGVCLPSGQCVCSPNWTGERCMEPILGVKCNELQLNNTIIKPLGSNNMSEVEATCQKGYQMSNGITALKLTCVEGMWLSSQPTHHEDALGCYPVCDLTCLNGGICVSPNKCDCPEFFKSEDCSKLVYGSCEAVMNKPANLTVERRNASLVLRCDSDRPVGPGDLEFILFCSYGEWITPKDWSWDVTCDIGGSCSYPHSPRNARISGNLSGIYMVCDEGFSIEGEKIVGLECIRERNAWALVRTKTFFLDDVNCTLDANATCDLDCGPNGVCVSYTCVCDPGWTGRFCSTQLCTSTDFLVDGSQGVSHIKPGEEVVVFCSAGHRLPSGTSSVKLICHEGAWMLSGVMLGQYRTMCKPLCDPPCHNLGICIEHNVCQCQFGFTGPRCTKCGSIPDLRLTTSGMTCKLPFTVNDKKYTDCLQADRDSLAWCPTTVNNKTKKIIGSGICLYDWGYRRITVTYSGKTCKFPFLFKDTLRFSCIKNGNLTYCPTITDKDYRPVEYEQCARDDDAANVINGGNSQSEKLLVTTTNGQICEFPFVYRGVTYNDCIKKGSQPAWCATKVDVNRKVQKYGVCIYNKAKDVPTQEVINIISYCQD